MILDVVVHGPAIAHSFLHRRLRHLNPERARLEGSSSTHPRVRYRLTAPPGARLGFPGMSVGVDVGDSGEPILAAEIPDGSWLSDILQGRDDAVGRTIYAPLVPGSVLLEHDLPGGVHVTVRVPSTAPTPPTLEAP
jgi:hypothetical protein